MTTIADDEDDNRDLNEEGNASERERKLRTACSTVKCRRGERHRDARAPVP
jgi:hypothetical protein